MPSSYSAFGLTILSDVPLPDAEPATGTDVNCRLLRHRGGPPAATLKCLGEEDVTNDVRVRLHETDTGLRLVFDDTGAFDFSADGRTITWWSGEREVDAAVQSDILGRVLAAALHCQGIMTLHASAVSLNGEGIAFLAPKFFGKSTIAATLVQSGARLLTDDTLAVESGPPPRLRPGIQTVRLWSDTAARHGVGKEENQAKARLRPATRIESDTTPFRTIYVLQPEPPERDSPVAVRTRCTAHEAIAAIVTFRKLGALLGGAAGGASFDAAVTVAQTVPAYRLRVRRDLARLEELAQTIRSWHSTSPGETAPTAGSSLSVRR